MPDMCSSLGRTWIDLFLLIVVRITQYIYIHLLCMEHPKFYIFHNCLSCGCFRGSCQGMGACYGV